VILEYRGLTIQPVAPSSLSKYLDLFKASFPRFKTSVEYIDWLYFKIRMGQRLVLTLMMVNCW
jgi:hypothetical protein